MNEFVINVQDTLNTILTTHIKENFLHKPNLQSLLLDYVPLKLAKELPTKQINNYNDIMLYAEAFKKSMSKLVQEFETKINYPYTGIRSLEDSIKNNNRYPYISSFQSPATTYQGQINIPLDVSYLTTSREL